MQQKLQIFEFVEFPNFGLLVKLGSFIRLKIALHKQKVVLAAFSTSSDHEDSTDQLQPRVSQLKNMKKWNKAVMIQCVMEWDAHWQSRGRLSMKQFWRKKNYLARSSIRYGTFFKYAQRNKSLRTPLRKL